MISERQREYRRQWARDHRDRVALYNKTWRDKNPGVASASALRWQKENLDRHADAERRRRARKRNAESDGHSRQQVFERDEGICQLCDTPLDPLNWHEDHIFPLSRGGSDLIDNCQATCPPCNQRKHAKVPA